MKKSYNTNQEMPLHTYDTPGHNGDKKENKPSEVDLNIIYERIETVA